MSLFRPSRRVRTPGGAEWELYVTLREPRGLELRSQTGEGPAELASLDQAWPLALLAEAVAAVVWLGVALTAGTARVLLRRPSRRARTPPTVRPRYIQIVTRYPAPEEHAWVVPRHAVAETLDTMAAELALGRLPFLTPPARYLGGVRGR